MTKQVSRGLDERVKVCPDISEQRLGVLALMIMGDHPSRDPPRPFNTVGIWVISRGIDEIQLLLQFGEQATHEQGTSGGVGLEIIGNHNGNPPATLRANYSRPHLFTKHIGRPSRSDPAIEPAIAPVYQTKAVYFAVVPRSLDQTLSPPPFTAPDPCEGWVKGKLHLILQIEVSLRQAGKQIRQIGGKLIPQISLDQVFDG